MGLLTFAVPVTESVEWSLMCGHVRPGDTVVDVGAHHGNYTYPMAAMVGLGGKVLAIEPDPTARRQLLDGVYHHNFSNVAVFPCAAAARAERQRTFYFSQTNAADNRLWALPEEKATCAQVETFPLDVLVPYHSQVSFLKIDVQGSETEVLRGARKVIERSPNIGILLEFWEYGIEHAGSSRVELLSLLEDYELTIYAIEARPRRLLRIDRNISFDIQTKRQEDEPETANNSSVINLWAVKHHWDLVQVDDGTGEERFNLNVSYNQPSPRQEAVACCPVPA